MRRHRSRLRAWVFGKTAVWAWAIGLAFLALLPLGTAQRSTALSGIHTIQVASVGTGSSAPALRQRIIDRLNRSGRVKVVNDAETADVVLRGSSSIWPTGTVSLNPRSRSISETTYQGYLSVELVGGSNQVLWSYLVTPGRLRMSTITDDLADRMVSHLLDAIAGGATSAASSTLAGAGPHVLLHAAGSTLAAPLYLKWFESSGMSVSYDAVGSEAGIEQLAASKVDFAASDMPLKDEELPAGSHLMQFPTVAGAVVPIYNVSGIGQNLQLTPETLAAIYQGTIRKWNDPRIREVNRGVHLPDTEIAVIHRSDGSGTTFVWTSFLSLTSPEWKSSAGTGARVAWPIGTNAVGNDGLASMVQKTPNSIGYVELIYAIQHQLSYAAVRNPAGRFIKADLASITAAAEDASKATDQEFRLSILNAPAKDAYPISTFTWLMVPAQGVDPQKKAAIVQLLTWMLTSGQKQCASLGYTPLPHSLVARELQAIGALK